MKNHVRLLTLFVLITGCVSFLTSCKDDDDASLIGTWKVTSAVFNPPVDSQGVLIADAYPRLFKPCNYDDLWIFEPNGVFKQDEVLIKCDTAQFYLGTYSQSGSTLTVATDSFTFFFGNTKVTDSDLTGTVLFSVSGGELPVDFRLTRQ